ncbi:hypothetical protein ACFQ3A_09555 [Sphaerisporangium aureirubrum]
MRMRVVLAAVALLGTGCSAAGADRPFAPGGEAAPVRTEQTAAPLSTQEVRTIQAGRNMSVQVEWPAGLTSGHQAIVEAFTSSYASSWKAVTSQGEDKGYLGAAEDQAARDSYTWVQSFVGKNRSVTGTAKLYAVQVASVTGRGAEVDACVDESAVKVTDATTGDPVPEQPDWTKPPTATYLQVAAIRRGADGRWRVKAYMHATYPHQRAKECAR